MQPSTFTTAITLLAAAGAASAQKYGYAPAFNSPCDKPGTYNCEADMRDIIVCNAQRRWQLSNPCRPGWCVFPAGYPTPWCDFSGKK